MMRLPSATKTLLHVFSYVAAAAFVVQYASPDHDGFKATIEPQRPPLQGITSFSLNVSRIIDSVPNQPVVDEPVRTAIVDQLQNAGLHPDVTQRTGPTLRVRVFITVSGSHLAYTILVEFLEGVKEITRTRDVGALCRTWEMPPKVGVLPVDRRQEIRPLILAATAEFVDAWRKANLGN